MPATFARYPSRRQIIEYLENYAHTQGLQIRKHKRVTRIQRLGNWVIGTEDGGTIWCSRCHCRDWFIPQASHSRLGDGDVVRWNDHTFLGLPQCDGAKHA